MILSEQIFNEFKLGIFNGFYKEVYPSLLTYAVRCLTSTYGYLAEDCVQDSIYQAFRKSNDFHSVAQLKSFLYIISVNAISLATSITPFFNVFASVSSTFQDAINVSKL